jgi:hypothetical protein
MVDRLHDIAAAHGHFGRGASEVEAMIGSYCEKIAAPISAVVLAIPARAAAVPAPPWNEPVELPSGLKPVKAFDFAFLPAPIAPWVGFEVVEGIDLTRDK